MPSGENLGSSPLPAPVDAMPGVSRVTISGAVAAAGELAALGVPGVLLFGIPDHKDAEGSGAWDEEGAVQLAVQAIKRSVIETEGLPEKEALAKELEIGWPILATEDAKEGPRAFMEKRKPDFKGK